MFFNEKMYLSGISSKYRSSNRRCSVKKGVIRNFAKFTGKYLRQSLFFNKVAGGPCNLVTLLKKRLWRRCFPVNFANFLRTLFLQNTFCKCPVLAKWNKFPLIINPWVWIFQLQETNYVWCWYPELTWDWHLNREKSQRKSPGGIF